MWLLGLLHDFSPTALPKCVLVDFGEDYTGPDEDSLSKIVPIYPEEDHWKSPGGQGDLHMNTMKMLLLKLSFA